MEMPWLFALAAVCAAGAIAYISKPEFHFAWAERLLRRGRDREAARHFEAAAALWTRRQGENSLAAAAACAGVASTRYLQSRDREGAELLGRAGRVVFAYAGKPQARLLQALTSLARAAYAAAQFQEAARIVERSLPLAIRTLEGADPRLAELETLLGDSYAAIGSFEPAYAHYGRALAVHRLGHGGSDAGSGGVLAAMAEAMVREERWVEARDLGMRAVEILDRPSYSPLLPRALGALADLHARRGQLQEAEDMRLSICQLWERLAGPASAALAREYERRAGLLRSMARETEAEFLLRKVAGMRRAMAERA